MKSKKTIDHRKQLKEIEFKSESGQNLSFIHAYSGKFIYEIRNGNGRFELETRLIRDILHKP